MRAQTANEPLDEDLEDGGSDERVEEANGGIVDVPEAAGADLHNEEDGKGDEEGHEGGGPDGDDFIAQRVGELGVDDFAVLEDDCRGLDGGSCAVGEHGGLGTGKATARGRVSHVDSKTDGSHGGHGEDVEPGGLEPLSKAGPGVGGRGGGLGRAPGAGSLLVGTRCSSRVCGGRGVAVEEAHGVGGVGGVVKCCGVVLQRWK